MTEEEKQEKPEVWTIEELVAMTETVQNAEIEYAGKVLPIQWCELTESEEPKMNLPRLVNEHLTKALREYFKHYPVLDTNDTALYSIRQKLQKTPISGGFHVWHHENGALSVFHRVLAWTIYLNDVEEGGETEFLYQSERVKPVKGRTFLFPAGFMHTHRGNPPISNEKYILTGWFNLRMDDNFYDYKSD